MHKTGTCKACLAHDVRIDSEGFCSRPLCVSESTNTRLRAQNADLQAQLATATAKLREMEADRRRLEYVLRHMEPVCTADDQECLAIMLMLPVPTKQDSKRDVLDAALAADSAGEGGEE